MKYFRRITNGHHIYVTNDEITTGHWADQSKEPTYYLNDLDIEALKVEFTEITEAEAFIELL
jgi:hypothetical protein